MIGALLKYWPFGIAVVAGFAFASVTVAPIRAHFAHNRGVEEGRAALAAENAALTLHAEQERAKSDATLRNLSDHDLCVMGLKRRGLPIDQCAGL